MVAKKLSKEKSANCLTTKRKSKEILQDYLILIREYAPKQNKLSQ